VSLDVTESVTLWGAGVDDIEAIERLHVDVVTPESG
jgi:hypothetical protein